MTLLSNRNSLLVSYYTNRNIIGIPVQFDKTILVSLGIDELLFYVPDCGKFLRAFTHNLPPASKVALGLRAALNFFYIATRNESSCVHKIINNLLISNLNYHKTNSVVFMSYRLLEQSHQ